MRRLLRAGANVVLWPGGLDEANSVEAEAPAKPQPAAAGAAAAAPAAAAGRAVNVRTRTGFIRLAVRHGVPVLPVFTFGELEAVSAVQPLPRPITRFLQATLRISTTLFVGRYGTPIPRRVPFNMCFGRPIPTSAPPAADADADALLGAEVARVHAAYKAELRRLYLEQRERFGYGGRELVFVCEAMEARKQARAL